LIATQGPSIASDELTAVPSPEKAKASSSRLVALGVLAACLALATLSLMLPYATKSDMWSWLIWGKEVSHLELDLHAGPAWKPLPVFLTTILSPFGHAAPDLFLLVVRAAWLLAVVLAYRIGARLAGRAAGLIAAFGMLLIPSAGATWLGYSLEGSSDPIVAALALGAIDRHLAGHRLQALALVCSAALGRPEAWPIAVAYALILWSTERSRRRVVILMVAAVPALWLGGGVWGAGNPLAAAGGAKEDRGPGSGPKQTAPLQDLGSSPDSGSNSDAARRFESAAPAPPPWRALATAANIVVLPFGLAALAAVVLALAGRLEDRRGAQVVIGLGAAALAWIAVLVAGSMLGLPVQRRFLLAPAAVLSILGAVGFVQLIRRVPSRPLRIGGAVALGGVTLAFALPRLSALPNQAHPKSDNRKERQALFAVLDESHARERVMRCGGNVNVFKANSGQVKWWLGLRGQAVGNVGKHGILTPARGILVVQGYAPGFSVNGSGPRVLNKWIAPMVVQQLATVGKFSVYDVGCIDR
jgi:hypothetical protein